MKVVSPLYVGKMHSKDTVESTLNSDYKNIYAKKMSDYRKMGGGDFDLESIDEFSSLLPPDEKNTIY